MPGKKTVERYRPNPHRSPKYRAECSDFYRGSEQDAQIAFRGPNAVLQAIEEASEQAGRTVNTQLAYVIEACNGRRPLHPDDVRTEDDWRSLLGQLEIRFDEGDEWLPGAAILGKPGMPSGTC